MRVFKHHYTKNGKTRQTKAWYVELTDHSDQARRIPAMTDKRASEHFGRQLERLVALRVAGEQPDTAMTRWLETLPKATRERLTRIGLLDARAVGTAKPLREHLADYERALNAKGNTAKHIQDTTQRIRTVLTAIGTKTLSTLRAAEVQEYLARRREAGLGITSSNRYLTSLKGFCRWIVREGRASSSPLTHLSKLNEQTDKRRERRALDPEELRWLLDVTRGGPVRFGMTGPARVMLYRLAVETGLRANELRSLSRRSFNFSGNPPTVKVEASYSKRRRTDELPLRKGTAGELRTFLEGVNSEDGVFGVPQRTAAMLTVDLRVSRARWIRSTQNRGERRERHRTSFLAVADDSGRIIDFHGLRHTFITNLARGGVHPKEAQDLARHSDINLTLSRYSHTVLADRAAAVESLPDLSTAEPARQRATGTCDIRPYGLPECLPERRAEQLKTVQRDARQDAAAGMSEGTQKLAKKAKNAGFRHENRNAPPGTRTPDPLIKSQLLCQLS